MGKRLDLCSGFQLKKCSKGKRPQDYISLLPDDILLVILSFLTYKEAAQMTILSRRWFNLWMHYPALLFYGPVGLERDTAEYHKFVNKVNRVLRCHKAQNLKVFRVTCDLDEYYQRDIDSWLDYALTRKVQSLEFNFLSEDRYKDFESNKYVFADRLLNFSNKISTGALDSDSNNFHSLRNFDFMSLTSVSLRSVWEITQLSAVAHFNKLKRLVLHFAPMGDESLAQLIYFLSNTCPNLEELVLALGWYFEPNRSNRSLRRKVKRCPLKRLEVVEIVGYYGRVSDVELIMDLMENARGLEKVTVDPYNPMNKTRYLSVETRYLSEEQIARSIALQQFESLRKFISRNVELVVR